MSNFSPWQPLSLHKDVLRYDGATLDAPLHAYVTPEQRQHFIESYVYWLDRKTPPGDEVSLATRVCFLDITYFRDASEEALANATTLLIGPRDEGAGIDSVGAYDAALNSFLSESSLAAHPVFRNGLPAFSDGAGGPMCFAETYTELNDLLDSDTPQVSDGFLWWTTDGPEGVRHRPTSHQRIPLAGTFKSLSAYSPGLQDRVTITSAWQAYVGAVMDRSTRIRSARDRPVATVVALPVGTRSSEGARRGNYQLVAMLFAGIDEDESRDQSLSRRAAVYLIEVMMAQLYRANARYVGELIGRKAGQAAVLHSLPGAVSGAMEAMRQQLERGESIKELPPILYELAVEAAVTSRLGSEQFMKRIPRLPSVDVLPRDGLRAREFEQLRRDLVAPLVRMRLARLRDPISQDEMKNPPLLVEGELPPAMFSRMTPTELSCWACVLVHLMREAFQHAEIALRQGAGSYQGREAVTVKVSTSGVITISNPCVRGAERGMSQAGEARNALDILARSIGPWEVESPSAISEANGWIQVLRYGSIDHHD